MQTCAACVFLGVVSLRSLDGIRSRSIVALAFAFWPLTLMTASSAQNEINNTDVTVEEDPSSFTLSNGIVITRVSKRSGDLISLQYKGLETLSDKSGHAGGYWSHDATGGIETITKVTIDPRKTGGARGEVSVKGISG